jgi:hypothetical protein
MNITCDRLDDLLLDGEPLALQTAANHAAGCAACAETLAQWHDLSATARNLHETWESDLLWPRIERGIRTERQQRSRARLWQLAAAVMLAALLGGGSWLFVRERRQEEFDARIIRVTAIDGVERAERAHVAAIEQLETVAQPKLDESASPLMISYKEKLLLLDDAIAQCQTAIQQNRQNAHLRKQLLAIYSEKQRTLQDVLREENHVARP